MSFANVQMFGNNLVVSEELDKQYSLVFDGCNYDGNSNSCIIPVKSRRDVELFLLSLGEEVSVIINEKLRKLYSDVWDWLNGHTYAEVFHNLKWSFREEEEVIDIIKRIPLPRIHNVYSEQARINQEYVHKMNSESVLISQLYKCGNMFYFKGFTKSQEFNIDHSSDHLEGIIIFEAARQAGIASIHLTGIALSARIVLLKTIIGYSKFIEPYEPYIIRTIPVIKPKGGYIYVVFDIIQKGNTCATGYLAGFLCKNKESYSKFRKTNLKVETLNEQAVVK